MCVCNYLPGHNRATRPCPPSHSMPLALVLPRRDQTYVLRKPVIRRDNGDILLLFEPSAPRSSPLLLPRIYVCVLFRFLTTPENIFITLFLYCLLHFNRRSLADVREQIDVKTSLFHPPFITFVSKATLYILRPQFCRWWESCPRCCPLL